MAARHGALALLCCGLCRKHDVGAALTGLSLACDLGGPLTLSMSVQEWVLGGVSVRTEALTGDPEPGTAHLHEAARRDLGTGGVGVGRNTLTLRSDNL